MATIIPGTPIQETMKNQVLENDQYDYCYCFCPDCRCKGITINGFPDTGDHGPCTIQ